MLPWLTRESLEEEFEDMTGLPERRLPAVLAGNCLIFVVSSGKLSGGISSSDSAIETTVVN